MRKINIPKLDVSRRQKIVVGINSLVSTTQPAYSNHIQLFYRLGRSYPNIDFCLVNPPRMSIDKMRNLAAETAMSIEATHLWFIDDDVLLPSPFDALDKLLACKAPVAAANVIIRGWPFNHMFFTKKKGKNGLYFVKDIPKEYRNKQMPVDAVGFSCCLIEVSLLKQLNKPFFITGTHNTEDIYFCLKVRDKFPDCKIIVDTSLVCGHILSAEIIEENNLKNYRQYFRKQFKPMDEKKNRDRGSAYYSMVKQLTNPPTKVEV